MRSNFGHNGTEILEGVLLMQHNLTYPDRYTTTDSIKEIQICAVAKESLLRKMEEIICKTDIVSNRNSCLPGMYT